MVTGHRDVTTRRYSVAEAKKSLSKLIREAEQGKDVYIIDEEKRTVKVVPLVVAKKRIPGGFDGKISWQPDAFDPLTDEEMEDLGFE